MSGDLDWGPIDVPKPPPPVPAPSIASGAKTSGRGGIIRNPTTKKVTMLSNPVNNPKPSKLGMTQSVGAPTPEEELAAEHPALAIPSIMTGMDMDTVKKNGTAPKPEPAPATQGVQTGQPMPVTYDSTLGELLRLAFNYGGTLNFGTGEFVLSIQLTVPAAKSLG